ncbi:Hsp20 family protein [Neisseriaceae bacterium PsAf]|nr:Hsp20 family protein [Neisseriaceae bacterium PsAf]
MAKDLVLKNELFDFLGLTNSPASNFKVDIVENENSYLVEAEIPGVEKSDIDVDFHNDVLTISVSRESKREQQSENSNVIISERSYGKASRQFAIRDVDEENVSAKYADGILTIELPKYSKAKESKKIEIQ